MKNFSLSLATVLAMSTLATAGGDIAPAVEPAVEVVAPAADDSGFYIGGAYSMSTIDGSGYGSDGFSDPMWEEYYAFDDIDVSGYMLQAGYQFNKYIAVEGRYWGTTSEINKVSGNTAYYYQGEPDGDGTFWWESDGDFSAWGIYVKPMYPVTESLTVYGLLGYGSVQVDDSSWDVYGESGDLIDDSGFQWGIGASYALSDHISLFVDYVQLASDGEGSWNNGEIGEPWYSEESYEMDVSTINVGMTYKF
jgi:opacity protein-like surface antigen